MELGVAVLLGLNLLGVSGIWFKLGRMNGDVRLNKSQVEIIISRCPVCRDLNLSGKD